MTTVQGFKPMKHQMDVIKHLTGNYYRGKTFIVKSHRQCGKSVMCENLLLYFACNNSNSISACVSPTLNQSRKLFKDIVSAAGNSGIIVKNNQSLLELELINGSTIFFKSGEQAEALRGYTLRQGILILDECAYLSDEILSLVLPWVAVNKCPILMVSTPKFKAGFFWRYWAAAKEEELTKPIYGWHSKAFDWNNYDTSMLMSEEQKAEYKKIFTKAQYKSEIEGEFIDDDGCVFNGFKELVSNNTPTYTKLFIGIDWGSGQGNDNTVLSAINEKGQQVELMVLNNMSTTQQIDKLSNYINLNKKYIKLVISEYNSIGKPFTDLLKEKCSTVKIEPFITTNNSKTDIINKLQLGFENKEILLLNHEQQLNELSSYACEFNPKTKVITYNAPQGLHDDMVMALCFAWNAYKSTAKGDYCFSF